MTESNQPAAGPLGLASTAGLGLAERLRLLASTARMVNMPGNVERTADEAAAEIKRLRGLCDRMDEELRLERDSRSVVQRALIMAAMLPHNQGKPAGTVREAAEALFGKDGVEAALQWGRPNAELTGAQRPEEKQR